MDYSKKTRTELIELCKGCGVKGYTAKKKEELIVLLNDAKNVVTEVITEDKKVKKVKKDKQDKQDTQDTQDSQDNKITRLNYIGSKFQLLDWLAENILQKTGWESFAGKTIADLFAGTGVVSHYFRKNGAVILSNDAELYSSIITHAFTRSVYTPLCKEVIEQLQGELDTGDYKDTKGFVTRHYSPYEGNERKFFTIDNGQRIDYLRARLEDLKSSMSEDEYAFVLASIIISADAVSNVPAVYGCFLKEFKAKALKSLRLVPIHTMVREPTSGSRTWNSDVLSDEFLGSFEADCVYLDPPYNERQYSKNYFPLNIIAKTPRELETEGELKGKTGIPVDCFISPFCKKQAVVEEAFNKLFSSLKTEWIFLSYNSESIVPRERMMEIMGKYGEVSVVERDYKRFKSFEYNDDKAIKEYLFACAFNKINSSKL
jgi:adenine-specific DNA-methyltransferase